MTLKKFVMPARFYTNTKSLLIPLVLLLVSSKRWCRTGVATLDRSHHIEASDIACRSIFLSMLTSSADRTPHALNSVQHFLLQARDRLRMFLAQLLLFDENSTHN